MYVKKGQLTAKERAEMMGGMSAVRKPLLLLLLVQAAMGAFAFAKGVGPEYLMICAGLIPCTVTVLVLARNADWYLAIWVLMLITTGFITQLITSGSKADVAGMLLKLAVAIAAASAAALAFRFWGKMLGREWAGILLMLLQACIYLFLAVKGTTVGQAGGSQAARITLEIAGNDIQILELTRMIYVCVLVLLLCKQSKDTFLFIPRETAAILYTVITMAVPVFFRDLGSSLIIGGIFLIVYTTFAKNRKQVLFMWIAVLIAAAVGVLLVIGLKDAGIFKKIYLRFYYFLFPEKDIARYGYQYIQIRQALAVGGLLGADSRRYMLSLIHISRGSIESVFSQPMGNLTSQENLNDMMSKSDFDVTSMGERQEITFLIMPDEKTTYNSLVTMFLKQSYELLIAKAEECGGKLPILSLIHI